MKLLFFYQGKQILTGKKCELLTGHELGVKYVKTSRWERFLGNTDTKEFKQRNYTYQGLFFIFLEMIKLI